MMRVLKHWHNPDRWQCPNPGNIQGQTEQPDLVEDVPAHCRMAGLDDL